MGDIPREDVVQVQFLDYDHENQELHSTSCRPSDAAYWVGCDKFKIAGSEQLYGVTISKKENCTFRHNLDIK
ncbi:hypothetical protein [Bacillus thuringiensis]|uniref:hypothetical protein n=1 Tax=Bacillus thuringiensis TaxID=1428 RepID=UPI002DB674A9|nr:hypothetical protein [Bacillus cereus]